LWNLQDEARQSAEPMGQSGIQGLVLRPVQLLVLPSSAQRSRPAARQERRDLLDDVWRFPSVLDALDISFIHEGWNRNRIDLELNGTTRKQLKLKVSSASTRCYVVVQGRRDAKKALWRMCVVAEDGTGVGYGGMRCYSWKQTLSTVAMSLPVGDYVVLVELFQDPRGFVGSAFAYSDKEVTLSAMNDTEVKFTVPANRAHGQLLQLPDCE